MLRYFFVESSVASRVSSPSNPVPVFGPASARSDFFHAQTSGRLRPCKRANFYGFAVDVDAASSAGLASRASIVDAPVQLRVLSQVALHRSL